MSQDLKKSVPWAWICAGLVVIVVIALLAVKAMDGMTSYYLTTDEYVRQKSSLNGKHLKIAGKVQAGSVKKDGDRTDFIVEYQGKSFPVSYTGLPPDTFKEGVDVVVEGKESGHPTFQADVLMAKCASKYEVGGLPPLEQMNKN